MTVNGKIIRGVGGFYYVVTADATIYECKAKGIFRLDDVKPLVGDDVVIRVLSEDEALGNIEEILPRKNTLIRPAVANVDQSMIVFSLTNPKPNRTLLDKFLLMMDRQGVPTWLCLTKTDLVDEGEMRDFLKAYEPCTEGVLPVNNMDGTGIRGVHQAIRNKTTVLAGPSGVGKSSLVAHICPDAGLEIGSISKKTRRGRHTTRHSEIYYIDEHTYIFDTPGFTALQMPDILPEDLRNYIPEFVPYEGDCRFPVCTHIHEPGCAVREAVGAGIDEKRYQSYQLMFEELNRMVVRAGRSKR